MTQTPTPSPWTRITETVCALGESPFWHPHEERLYWVDTALKRLWRLHAPSGHTEHWDLPQEPGSIAPCRSGGLLIAMRDGIYLSRTWQDIPQKLADAPYDTTRVRFSDGKCDPWGRFWVGTHVESGNRPDGALYCLQTRKQVHPDLVQVERGVLASNGLAWAPDGRTVYWADTARHAVTQHEMAQPGQWPPMLGMTNPLARFPAQPQGWRFDDPDRTAYQGRPDGAAVDTLGRYWVAMYEGARVLCLSPTGDILADHPTPAQCPTMVCFGGTDLCTLYVTTARAHRSSAELAHYPDSGAVFSMRVDTPGLPVQMYWD